MTSPRSSGILLHITSLPSPHGIGDLGPSAYIWVDQLAAARQSWWQILPLGPTGYADSPYQCFSAFAGNPNLISCELLVKEGLLTANDLPPTDLPREYVDYDRVAPLKLKATALAHHRFQAHPSSQLTDRYETFCREHEDWLTPFAIFLAIKEFHGGIAWYEWPMEHRKFDRTALAPIARELAPQVNLHKFRQFLFFDQWRQLKDYAHRRGIRFIGDMPIFIAGDSADAWSHPDLFQLDDQRRPAFVAGVPPDYFSKTGQLWGNPLYNWQRHELTRYSWWIDRVRRTLDLVDLVRLDHFRGFEAYWSVPAGSPTAEPGRWIQAPGTALFTAMQQQLGTLPLIAEDLGVITPPVDAMRLAFNLPGMNVLQFAFGGAQEDRFYPHNFSRRSVVYTGTHDNETTAGWYLGLTPRERAHFERYAPGSSADPAWTLIRLAWASVADVAVAPMQDVLRLGNEARMNLPGRTEGNWRWRMTPDQFTAAHITELAELTQTYQREPAATAKS